MNRWILAALLMLSGCSRPEPLGAADERFIAVLVELRRASVEQGDPAGFEVEKQRILGTAGLSEAELRAWAERNAGDVERMAAVWDSVNARLARPDER